VGALPFTFYFSVLHFAVLSGVGYRCLDIATAAFLHTPPIAPAFRAGLKCEKGLDFSPSPLRSTNGLKPGFSPMLNPALPSTASGTKGWAIRMHTTLFFEVTNWDLKSSKQPIDFNLDVRESGQI